VKVLFQDRILRCLCPGWLWTMIFLIFASWVTRIIGASDRHPARHYLFPWEDLIFKGTWFSPLNYLCFHYILW
jgi:hypothetical protein